MRATFTVPFIDFDYVAMAKACGASCIHHDDYKLIVTGTPESIESLSRELTFWPDEIEPDTQLAG